jgi:hypothetical protein
VAAVLTALKQAWPNAGVDLRDPAGVWGNALAGLNSDQIRHGIRQLSLTTREWPPTPGQFRESSVAYRPTDEAAPVQRVMDLSAHGRAWRACQVAFSKRLTGISMASPPVETDFDIEYVLASTPRPKSSSLIEHHHAWAKLKSNFDSEWARVSGGVRR